MEMNPEMLAQLKRQAKAHMRKRARSVRGSMSRSAIAARSSKINQRLAELEVIRDARKIALFFPMEEKNEVDLRGFDRVLRERGAEIGYPSVDPETREMVFRTAATIDSMEERGLGFAEPDPTAPELSDPRVVVVPALAVDLSGHRLGYGAGFYDRVLARLRAEKVDFVSVVVAFDFQLASEIPVDDFDIACDWIVTDTRSLVAER